VPAEEPRDADNAVLRRSGGADPRRHGLRARHESERIYREVKVMMIGGTEEIMKELAARRLGV
jgi:alkylation response protein AidB-like acyl-CoA dehydrogenase